MKFQFGAHCIPNPIKNVYTYRHVIPAGRTRGSLFDVIVALKQISSMENNELILKKVAQRIPIGANYKEVFMERMKSKLMS